MRVFAMQGSSMQTYAFGGLHQRRFANVALLDQDGFQARSCREAKLLPPNRRELSWA
jgi:hypothetical protein